MGHTLCFELPGRQSKNGNALTMMPFASVITFQELLTCQPSSSPAETGRRLALQMRAPRQGQGHELANGRDQIGTQALRTPHCLPTCPFVSTEM